MKLKPLGKVLVGIVVLLTGFGLYSGSNAVVTDYIDLKKDVQSLQVTPTATPTIVTPTASVSARPTAIPTVKIFNTVKPTSTVR